MADRVALKLKLEETQVAIKGLNYTCTFALRHIGVYDAQSLITYNTGLSFESNSQSILQLIRWHGGYSST